MSKLVFFLLLLGIMKSMTDGAAEMRPTKDCGGDDRSSSDGGEGCHGGEGGEDGSGSGYGGGMENVIPDNGGTILIVHPTNQELQTEVYLFAGILGGFVLLISAVVTYLAAEVAGLKTKLKRMEKKQASSAPSERSRYPPPAYTVRPNEKVPHIDI